tara:strand:- start:759 stop:1076 length:318 start_codon:yes stop_codon:yes gene_type:complete
MNIIFRNIVLFFITLVLANCAAKSATTMKTDSYKAGCEVGLKILKSYGDTLRIEHSPDEYEKAMSLSKSYCEERKKLSTKNQSNCDGCCRTTYICKGELKIDEKS